MSSPVVAAHRLGRQRPDGGWLLQDISLTLEPGERIALLGPSGSGKSLMMRALALLDPVEAGTVEWHGEPIPDARIPDFRGSVIYLHQTPHLRGPTVEAELEAVFSLRRHRRAGFDRNSLLERLARLDRGEEFLRRSIRVLSGGEAQIVAVLRALQLEPEALLLDEPTAAVDAAAAAVIERLVEEWHEAGGGRRALIWVAHDRDQAVRMTDRSIAIHRGRLAEGSPS